MTEEPMCGGCGHATQKACDEYEAERGEDTKRESYYDGIRLDKEESADG